MAFSLQECFFAEIGAYPQASDVVGYVNVVSLQWVVARDSSSFSLVPILHCIGWPTHHPFKRGKNTPTTSSKNPKLKLLFLPEAETTSGSLQKKGN